MSVYNKDFNCLFIHIPKTGGTSIKKILGGKGHKNLDYFLRFFEQHSSIDHEKLFKFAFIRNPYERFASACSRLEVSDMEGALKLAYKIVDCEFEQDSFPEIITRPQHLFLYPIRHMDFIGRFEEIDEDWQVVCEVLGIKDRLPHLNASKHSNWDYYESDKTKELLDNFYRKDIELYLGLQGAISGPGFKYGDVRVFIQDMKYGKDKPNSKIAGAA